MDEYIFEYNIFPLIETSYNKSIRKKRPVILLPFALPEIPIDNNTLKIAALIDSGADMSVSFKSIGEALGLRFSGSPAESISGISGEEKAWKLPVKVKIGDYEVLTNVNWMSREMNTDSDYPFVLGRESIFDSFDIEFSSNQKIIFRRELL